MSEQINQAVCNTKKESEESEINNTDIQQKQEVNQDYSDINCDTHNQDQQNQQQHESKTEEQKQIFSLTENLQEQQQIQQEANLYIINEESKQEEQLQQDNPNTALCSKITQDIEPTGIEIDQSQDNQHIKDFINEAQQDSVTNPQLDQVIQQSQDQEQINSKQNNEDSFSQFQQNNQYNLEDNQQNHQKSNNSYDVGKQTKFLMGYRPESAGINAQSYNHGYQDYINSRPVTQENSHRQTRSSSYQMHSLQYKKCENSLGKQYSEVKKSRKEVEQEALSTMHRLALLKQEEEKIQKKIQKEVRETDKLYKIKRIKEFSSYMENEQKLLQEQQLREKQQKVQYQKEIQRQKRMYSLEVIQERNKDIYFDQKQIKKTNELKLQVKKEHEQQKKLQLHYKIKMSGKNSEKYKQFNTNILSERAADIKHQIRKERNMKIKLFRDTKIMDALQEKFKMQIQQKKSLYKQAEQNKDALKMLDYKDFNKLIQQQSETIPNTFRSRSIHSSQSQTYRQGIGQQNKINPISNSINLNPYQEQCFYQHENIQKIPQLQYSFMKNRPKSVNKQRARYLQ